MTPDQPMPEGVRSDTEADTEADIEPSVEADVETDAEQPGAAVAGEPGIAPTAAEPDRFAAQRAVLAGLAERPLDEHADAFAQVHAQLQAALAEIDGI